MTYNVTLPKGTTAGFVSGMIASYNSSSIRYFDSPLRNIVFNSHGYPGRVSIGGMREGGVGIDISTLLVFARLRSLNLGTIWLTSCDCAGGGSGPLFCQMFAAVAGTTVIASDAAQIVTFGEAVNLSLGASNKLDDYDGNVYMFTADGHRRIIDPNRDVVTVKD